MPSAAAIEALPQQLPQQQQQQQPPPPPPPPQQLQQRHHHEQRRQHAEQPAGSPVLHQTGFPWPQPKLALPLDGLSLPTGILGLAGGGLGAPPQLGFLPPTAGGLGPPPQLGFVSGSQSPLGGCGGLGGRGFGGRPWMSMPAGAW